MQITDPIADMLTRIRNANCAKHDTVDIPASKMKKAIAEILLEEGYIKSPSRSSTMAPRASSSVTLKYLPGNEKVIQGLRRVSKPGLRVYAGADELPHVLSGLGISHHFHFQGRHDRQEGQSRACRRRSPCFRMVRRVRDMSRIGRDPISHPGRRGSHHRRRAMWSPSRAQRAPLPRTLCPRHDYHEDKDGVLTRCPPGRRASRTSAPARSHPHPASQHGRRRHSTAYSKTLEINGVGYRAAEEGRTTSS